MVDTAVVAITLVAAASIHSDGSGLTDRAMQSAQVSQLAQTPKLSPPQDKRDRRARYRRRLRPRPLLTAAAFEHELASKGITPSGRFSPVQELTPMPVTYPLPVAISV
jgi:hypothetical protein